MTAAEVAIRLKAVEHDVEALDRIVVRGNGKPSLQEDVRTIKKFIEDESESRKYWSRMVIGALLVNMISIGFAAFVWFVKVWPVLDQLSREAAVVVR